MSRSEAPPDLPLHVEVRGEGPPILLVHGYGASSHSFRLWVPTLAQSHRVILVDLKGFGSAPKPDDDRYSPIDLARPLADLVVRMGLTDLTLLGHSLGGAVILVAALALLDAGELGRLRALVGLAGTAYPQKLPPFAVIAQRPRLFRIALTAIPKRWLIRRVLRTVVYDPGSIDAAQVEGYAAPLRSAGARRALVASARQLVPPDADRLTSRYPELDVPTLLLWGRQDPVVPLGLAKRLRAALPRARLVILDRCGHLPAEEQPAESLRVVEDFLGDLPG
jgi:pimeloyl-ACP methyl ester carboxylesterase